MDLEAYKRLNRAMAIRNANYDYLLPSNLGNSLLLANIFNMGLVPVKKEHHTYYPVTSTYPKSSVE